MEISSKNSFWCALIALALFACGTGAQTISISPQPTGWDAGDISPYLNLGGYPVLDYSSPANQVGLALDNINQPVIISVRRDLNWSDGVQLHAILTRQGAGRNAVLEPVGTTVEITTSSIQFLSATRQVRNCQIQYRLFAYDALPEEGNFSTTVTYTLTAQ